MMAMPRYFSYIGKAAIGHSTVYSVISVNVDAKTVKLKLVGRKGPLLKDIPWTALQCMEEQDVNQAAARIVRDKTDS
jgi:hypothetical protein